MASRGNPLLFEDALVVSFPQRIDSPALLSGTRIFAPPVPIRKAVCIDRVRTLIHRAGVKLTDTTPTVYNPDTHSVVDFVKSSETERDALARLAEYGPNLIVLPLAEAWQRHEDAAKTEPTEITEAHWHEMLNVLPPVAWTRDSNGESFKMSERTTGAITAIYVALNGRHFTFSDDIRMPHKECCARVFHSPAYRSGKDGRSTTGGQSRGAADADGREEP